MLNKENTFTFVGDHCHHKLQCLLDPAAKQNITMKLNKKF